MERVAVGIVGAGSIGEVHAGALSGVDGAELVAVCSTNRERVEGFARRHGVARATTDYRELLRLPDLDAVVVATPNDTHAPLSIAALEAGKHVLCEKPMALNAHEAGEMVAASRRVNRVLMIGMCRRFDERTVALRGFVENGDLGQVRYARAGYTRRWGNPGGWFSVKEHSGGGPVIDLGVHIIDLVRYVLGGPRAVAVSASVFKGTRMPSSIRGVSKYTAANHDSYSDVEDGAAAFIRFDTGLILSLEVSWVQYRGRDEVFLELYGDEGGATYEPQLELYGTRGGYLVNIKPLIEHGTTTTSYTFGRQARHFIDCVTTGCPCMSPPEDGVEVMRIVDAIYQSANEGREVWLGEAQQD